MLASLPVDGYWLDSDEVEFYSDCNELPDVGPMNLKKNVNKEDTEIGGFHSGNLDSNKERVNK